MSIQLLGNQKVKDIYIGNKNIERAYKGNDLIYDKNKIYWIVKDGLLVNPIIIPLSKRYNSVISQVGTVQITQQDGYVRFYGSVLINNTTHVNDQCYSVVTVNNINSKYNKVHIEFKGGTLNTSNAPSSQQYKMPANYGAFGEMISRNWNNKGDYRYSTFVEKDSDYIIYMICGRWDQTYNHTFTTTLDAQVKNMYFYLE